MQGRRSLPENRVLAVAETIRFRVHGRDVEVGAGAVLGRSRSADVSIPHPLVSRRHAQVHRNSAGWFLTDLDSSNGVYDPRVADGPTHTVYLTPGVTRFHLGPPDRGCEVEAVVPEPAQPLVPSVATTRLAPDPQQAATTRIPDAHPPTARMPQPGAGRPGPTPPVAAPRVGMGAVLHDRARGADPASAPRAPAPPPDPPRPRVSPPAAPAPPSGASPVGVTVRAEGLTVIVDDELVILDEATLSIEGGTLTAIIGPSGCGKSTLANLLSGRSTPTKGTVLVDGQSMSPALRQRIGSVPQYDAVHERLKVRHALAAAARLRLPDRTPESAIDQAVTRTAQVLGLDHRLDTRVSKLSGGQKKRVSVGYELVADPVMMVLDEPTSGLDPGLEQELISELRAIADRGTTTIVVTHSTVAARQADLVVAMAPGGHVAFVGPPDQVLDHFAALTWAEVFNLLAPNDGQRWAAHFAGTPAYRRHVLAPPRAHPAPAQGMGLLGGARARSWGRDWGVMTVRYLRSLVADPRSLLLLAAQAPVLGLLFAAVLSTRVFATGLRPSTAAREMVLASVLAMVWIGASNSIREIVKERSTFLRERAVGVAASALVASRWAVLGVITVIQATVLYLAAVSRQTTPLTEGVLVGSGPLEMILALVAVGLASVGIGLVISGAVRDAAKSMAVLPIVLIPVILFSGLLIPVANQMVLENLSWLNPIQWGSSAAATTADVLAREGCNPTGLQAQIQQVFLGRTITCTNPRWQPTATAQALNLGLAVVSVGVLVWLSFVVTARSTRNLRA